MTEKLPDRRVAGLCSRFSNVVKDRPPEDQQIRHLVQQVIYLEEACRSVAESISCLEKSDDSETQRTTAWELKSDFQFLRTLLNEKRFLSALKLIEDDLTGTDHGNDCACCDDQTSDQVGPDVTGPETRPVTDPCPGSDQPAVLTPAIAAPSPGIPPAEPWLATSTAADLGAPADDRNQQGEGALSGTGAGTAETHGRKAALMATEHLGVSETVALRWVWRGMDGHVGSTYPQEAS